MPDDLSDCRSENVFFSTSSLSALRYELVCVCVGEEGGGGTVG